MKVEYLEASCLESRWKMQCDLLHGFTFLLHVDMLSKHALEAERSVLLQFHKLDQ
jgi:hypothetical protein